MYFLLLLSTVTGLFLGIGIIALRTKRIPAPIISKVCTISYPMVASKDVIVGYLSVYGQPFGFEDKQVGPCHGWRLSIWRDWPIFIRSFAAWRQYSKQYRHHIASHIQR